MKLMVTGDNSPVEEGKERQKSFRAWQTQNRRFLSSLQADASHMTNLVTPRCTRMAQVGKPELEGHVALGRDHDASSTEDFPHQSWASTS
jgi:hypothetical protein